MKFNTIFAKDLEVGKFYKYFYSDDCWFLVLGKEPMEFNLKLKTMRKKYFHETTVSNIEIFHYVEE